MCWWSKPLRVVIALAWTQAALIPADRELQLLVTPELSATRPLPSLAADKIEAKVGNKPYRVVRVEGKETTERAPVVIVADFEDTAVENQACLTAELVPVMRRLEATGINVFAIGRTPPYIYTVDMGRGPGDIQMLGFSDEAKLKKACEEARSHPPEKVPDWMEPFLYGRIATDTLWNILRTAEGSEGPVRILWLADRFDWFKPKQPGSDPTPKLDWIGAFSKGGASLYPILVGGTPAEPAPAPQKPKKKAKVEKHGNTRLEEAEALAAVGGGFATQVGRDIGATLDRVLRATDDSYVIHLSGPDSEGPAADPEFLTLSSTDAAVPLKYRRPLELDPPNDLPGPVHYSALRTSRLFLPSDKLGLRVGCSSKCERPVGAAMTVILPDAVRYAPAGKLDVYLQYTDPPLPMRQRPTFHRAQAAEHTPPELDCICLPLEDVKDKLAFRIVVYDETTRWLGAESITLERAKPKPAPE